MAQANSGGSVMAATNQDNPDELKRALEHGQDPNETDIHKRTALMIAARRGRTGLVRILIGAGADVNRVDAGKRAWDGKCTALHFACEGNHLDAVRLLLAAGANPDCAAEYGHTPLSEAIASKRTHLVRLLLESGADPNGPTKCACSPLQSAALADNRDLILELLSRGADPNRIGGNGAIALGATHRHDCIEALILGGADPNRKYRGGLTVLPEGILVLSPETIAFLIRSGADVNLAEDQGGMTALHFAAGGPRFENAKLLIDAGANVNALNAAGETPLDVCKILLSRNCNDNHERVKIANLIREHGGICNSFKESI